MSESDDTVLVSDVPLPLLHRGKVRDVYDAGNDMLLMVASDRVSAYDVVMAQPIPRKGEVLTQLTAWWMDQLGEITPHHLIAVEADDIIARLPDLAESRARWERRSMLVRRTTPVLVECVVRGYISGSAWREYRDHGTLAGEALPKGLRESQKLPEPIFSPATKAQSGHDENITFAQVCEAVGDDLAKTLRARSFHVYGYGMDVAREKGILLADTKFEFGTDSAGRLILIDEVLTPDSSRYWPLDRYQVGRGQPSLDKQPIRDFLDTLEDWDKTPPPPELPDHVVDAATTRYLEVFRRLTGIELNDFEPPRFDG